MLSLTADNWTPQICPYLGRYFRTFVFCSSMTVGSSSGECPWKKNGLTEVGFTKSLSHDDLIWNLNVNAAHCILSLISWYWSLHKNDLQIVVPCFTLRQLDTYWIAIVIKMILKPWNDFIEVTLNKAKLIGFFFSLTKIQCHPSDFLWSTGGKLAIRKNPSSFLLKLTKARYLLIQNVETLP